MEPDTEWAGGDYEKYSLERPDDRLGFIRKVYSILTVQLFITAGLVAISAASEDYQDFVYDNYWLVIVFAVLAIIVICVLFFVPHLHKKVPYNYILLFVFTILEALTVSFVTAFYSPTTILIAAGCTFGLTLSLTIYAFVTKTDFTKHYGIMIVLSFGLFVFGLLFFFVGYGDIYRLVFCPIAVVIYGIFLIYDTQLIVGEKRHKIGYDDYVLGAVALYVDIVGIFLYILAMFGEK
ncbi:hypothetical protein SteCoe_11993 [Stentor coeruleus]|uniref:Uncharacterized protein n=1 Tax=Stentor coeruleus TaxID=5963 RepID=A0A1R2CBW8_9CILI|nr:hypothetical protein SteCoe_11993 [Stentor coeruleus]